MKLRLYLFDEKLFNAAIIKFFCKTNDVISIAIAIKFLPSKMLRLFPDKKVYKITFPKISLHIIINLLSSILLMLMKMTPSSLSSSLASLNLGYIIEHQSLW